MEHFYNTVPGWAAFGKLYIQMVKEAKGGEHFVEIGSWLGRSAALMAVEIANSRKDIKFDCIDPWSDGGPDLKHKVVQMKESIYDQFLRNTRPVASYITTHRMPSLEGVKLYEDQSLDFVLIDGSHQYEDVKADIAAWLPKMKKGGLLAGDDYNWSGVSRAVREAFGENAATIVENVRTKNKQLTNPKYWSIRVA